MPHPDRTRPPAASAIPAGIAHAFDAFCAAERVPDDVAWRIRVVLDELVSNILAHGTSGGAVPTIDVTFRRDAASVSAVIADDGPPFNPLARPDPSLTLPLDARTPGGLGIVLVKTLMDVVTYERTTQNVVTVSKSIGPPDSPDGPGA